MKIEISRKAENDLDDILNYISEFGYPETAENYLNRMKLFINSLTTFVEKYPLCKNKILKFANYRCATFELTYIFIYKIMDDKLKLIRVVHGKNLT